MLKDKLAKFLDNSKNNKDPININLMDGFVDVKAYKNYEDGSRKLIYHDCGDNVVTDWMRHAIMMLLTGYSFSDKGHVLESETTNSKASLESKERVSAPYIDERRKDGVADSKGKNLDGYLLNGYQYFWGTGSSPLKYSQSSMGENYKYSLFPTKVLLGTGKEYQSWDVLKSENEASNASWYQDMLNKFGGDENVAKTNFDTNIKLNCNEFSGTISNGIHSGDGRIIPMRTVNDPRGSSSTKAETSAALMNRNYNVVGAIKTIYFSETDDRTKLQSTITDGGRLLRPANEGVGRPAFIYFGTPVKGSEGSERAPKEGWDDPASDVSLSKDNGSDYINKITFKVKMPSQSSSDNSVGKYYPYNGFTLRQMGLYNDAKLCTAINDTGGDVQNNMAWGMLLAVKNIVALDKTADVDLVLTWTLTI